MWYLATIHSQWYSRIFKGSADNIKRFIKHTANISSKILQIECCANLCIFHSLNTIQALVVDLSAKGGTRMGIAVRNAFNFSITSVQKLTAIRETHCILLWILKESSRILKSHYEVAAKCNCTKDVSLMSFSTTKDLIIA